MDPFADTVFTYSSTELLVNLVLAAVIGVALSLVYKSTHKGLSYSQSFSQTIVFVTVIVAIVMMVIEGSLARAFALVGAFEDVPTCVPKTSCKMPGFPKDSATKYGYTHNTDKGKEI